MSFQGRDNYEREDADVEDKFDDDTPSVSEDESDDESIHLLRDEMKVPEPAPPRRRHAPELAVPQRGHAIEQAQPQRNHAAEASPGVALAPFVPANSAPLLARDARRQPCGHTYIAVSIDESQRICYDPTLARGEGGGAHVPCVVCTLLVLGQCDDPDVPVAQPMERNVARFLDPDDTGRVFNDIVQYHVAEDERRVEELATSLGLERDTPEYTALDSVVRNTSIIARGLFSCALDLARIRNCYVFAAVSAQRAARLITQAQLRVESIVGQPSVTPDVHSTVLRVFDEVDAAHALLMRTLYSFAQCTNGVPEHMNRAFDAIRDLPEQVATDLRTLRDALDDVGQMRVSHFGQILARCEHSNAHFRAAAPGLNKQDLPEQLREALSMLWSARWNALYLHHAEGEDVAPPRDVLLVAPMFAAEVRRDTMLDGDATLSISALRTHLVDASATLTEMMDLLPSYFKTIEVQELCVNVSGALALASQTHVAHAFVSLT